MGLGRQLEHKPVAHVHSTGIPGGDERDWWAPAWAVLLIEAEPCSEQAREQAIERATRDTEFRDALMTIAGFDDRKKMADFIHEHWEPTNA